MTVVPDFLPPLPVTEVGVCRRVEVQARTEGRLGFGVAKCLTPADEQRFWTEFDELLAHFRKEPEMPKTRQSSVTLKTQGKPDVVQKFATPDDASAHAMGAAFLQGLASVIGGLSLDHSADKLKATVIAETVSDGNSKIKVTADFNNLSAADVAALQSALGATAIDPKLAQFRQP